MTFDEVWNKLKNESKESREFFQQAEIEAKKILPVAYICDGCCSCSGKVGCYQLGRPGMDYCWHTFDYHHAKNGICNDPANHPERFRVIDLTDTQTCYWEGEIPIP